MEGRKVTIKVNGKAVDTFIGEDGLQRFPNNKIISWITRGNKEFFSYVKLWDMVETGLFDVEDARLIYQNNGYSLCGYTEIFPDDKIENPEDKKGKAGHGKDRAHKGGRHTQAG